VVNCVGAGRCRTLCSLRPAAAGVCLPRSLFSLSACMTSMQTECASWPTAQGHGGFIAFDDVAALDLGRTERCIPPAVSARSRAFLRSVGSRRDEVHGRGLWHRSVHVWVVDHALRQVCRPPAAVGRDIWQLPADLLPRVSPPTFHAHPPSPPAHALMHRCRSCVELSVRRRHCRSCCSSARWRRSGSPPLPRPANRTLDPTATQVIPAET
jgi:hypothetical protein